MIYFYGQLKGLHLSLVDLNSFSYLWNQVKMDCTSFLSEEAAFVGNLNSFNKIDFFQNLIELQLLAHSALFLSPTFEDTIYLSKQIESDVSNIAKNILENVLSQKEIFCFLRVLKEIIRKEVGVCKMGTGEKKFFRVNLNVFVRIFDQITLERITLLLKMTELILVQKEQILLKAL